MIKSHANWLEFRDAGSMNSLIALSGFIAHDVFLTKAGHVGMVWRLQGVDSEGLDHTQRAAVVRRFNAALRLLDERFRLYSYLVKSPAAAPQAGHSAQPAGQAAVTARADMLQRKDGEMFDVELYLVVLYEHVTAVSTSAQLGRSVRTWLRVTATVEVLDQDLDAAVTHLRHAADGLEAHLADVVQPTRLEKAEAFRFFRRLVNYSGPDVRLKYDSHLDYFIADAPVDCHRSYLDVGDARVKVLTMKDAPAHTFAGLLDDISALPVSCIACLEWHRIPTDAMRRVIDIRTKHFTGKRGNKANESLDTQIQEHGAAVAEMDVHGRIFGECSLTLVLHDAEAARVERGAADAAKLLAARDGCFIDESYNLLHAWAAVVPGNRALNVRYLPLLDTHAADLAFLFAPDHGQPDTAVAILESRHGAPYHYALHVQDVGHTLVLGATGSGKSFWLNFLLLHLQQREPQTIVFDLGHSYRTLAGKLGGSYLELGLQCGVRINPFALPGTPENWHFLHAFCRVLCDGPKGREMDPADDRSLYEAIVDLYVLPPSLRQLRHLLPSRAVQERLQPWVNDGEYAALFDNVEDTLDVADFQVFEFEAMQQYPQLLEPLLFYILHRVQARMGSNLTVCVMDEAWRFIKHPKLRDYVEEALKTWRKRIGAMILATQSVEDFEAAALQRTVLEQCPTTIFLANPGMDRATGAALFGLNEQELDLHAGLIPKRELMLKRQAVTKVLTLNVDPISAAMFAAKG
jgi:type IV secretion system protein TrbE